MLRKSQYLDEDDKTLLDLLVTGDRGAFAELYNRYWKRLLAIAANKVGEIEEAEEIVQDIFATLWNRREELTITGELSIYLAVAVKYKVIKALARRRKWNHSPIGTLALPDDSTQEWVEFADLQFRLNKLIVALPEKCRIVYQLSRESGYTQKQIASELNISEKTVESHLRRALKFIRMRLTSLLIF